MLRTKQVEYCGFNQMVDTEDAKRFLCDERNVVCIHILFVHRRRQVYLWSTPFLCLKCNSPFFWSCAVPNNWKSSYNPWPLRFVGIPLCSKDGLLQQFELIGRSKLWDYMYNILQATTREVYTGSATRSLWQSQRRKKPLDHNYRDENRVAKWVSEPHIILTYLHICT